MEYTKNFKLVKGYYDSGLWELFKVLNVVNKKTGITEAEYKEITGFTYPNTTPDVVEETETPVEEPVEPVEEDTPEETPEE